MSNMTEIFRLTKYEQVRILGTRAEQLAHGAEPTVDIGNLIDPIDIARKELAEGKLPIELIRTMPNGQKNIIKLSNV